MKKEQKRISKRMKELRGKLRQKSRGGNYYYRLTITNGVRKEFALKTANEEEAIQKAADLDAVYEAPNQEVAFAQINAIKGFSKRAMKLTFAEGWEKYSSHPDRATPHTVAEQLAYKSTYEEFAAFAAAEKVEASAFYDKNPRYNALREKAIELALKNLEHPDSPGWKTQMCCMPGVGKIWQWDSCFMALYALDLPGVIEPMNNLDNLYLCQREDGFMAMAYIIETRQPAFGELINPPLFAWVEWEYFKRTGDDSRFERIFPILDKYYLWLKNNRRRTGSGLYFFESPGASGMDNSPRGGWPSFQNNGSDVSHIDLICQQLLSARCLADIAQKLDNGKAEFYLAEAGELVKLINRYHWNEKTGFYYDLFERSRPESYRSLIGNKTAAAFWTLISGAASPEQADALEKHLLNPDEFLTEHPIPAISRDDPNYHASGWYWLGGVWPPMVYMTVAGLKKYGKLETARLIARKHLDAMYRTFDEFEPRTIWECYSPEYMCPAEREEGVLVRKDFVGWGGLGPIAFLSDKELWDGFSEE